MITRFVKNKKTFASRPGLMGLFLKVCFARDVAALSSQHCRVRQATELVEGATQQVPFLQRVVELIGGTLNTMFAVCKL